MTSLCSIRTSVVPTLRFRRQPRPAARSSSIDLRLAPVSGRLSGPVKARLHNGHAALLAQRAAAAES